MIHSFDTEIAEQYGVNAAIILNNMFFWVEKNIANETNFFDGRYWTYNSVKAFSKLFPYLTTRAIGVALKKLIDDGLVVTGNYNKSSYDRTLWYAITEKGYSIIQKCKMDDSKMQNGNVENVEPIPDNIPDNKHSLKTTDIKPDKEDKVDYQRIVDMYNETCASYPRLRSLSEARKKALRARVHSGFTMDDFRELFTRAEQSSFLKGKNDRNWSATFDWMIKDANAAKILDGNYTDKAPSGMGNNRLVEINGKQYICKNGKYYIPNGSGVAVDPYAPDDLPF